MGPRVRRVGHRIRPHLQPHHTCLLPCTPNSDMFRELGPVTATPLGNRTSELNITMQTYLPRSRARYVSLSLSFALLSVFPSLPVSLFLSPAHSCSLSIVRCRSVVAIIESVYRTIVLSHTLFLTHTHSLSRTRALSGTPSLSLSLSRAFSTSLHLLHARLLSHALSHSLTFTFARSFI